MPRLFLPNIAAGVIPKDVSYPSLDIQAVVPARVSISSRTRCEKADALSSIPYSSSFRHSPSCGNRSELSPFITIFMFCDAKIRRKNGTTNHSNQNLVKERLCYFLFSFVYSIGRIIDSMNWISSSVRPYFAGNAETGTCFAQSISPKKIEWLREIYLNKDGKNEGVGKTRRQYRYTALFGSADC